MAKKLSNLQKIWSFGKKLIPPALPGGAGLDFGKQLVDEILTPLSPEQEKRSKKAREIVEAAKPEYIRPLTTEEKVLRFAGFMPIEKPIKKTPVEKVLRTLMPYMPEPPVIPQKKKKKPSMKVQMEAERVLNTPAYAEKPLAESPIQQLELAAVAYFGAQAVGELGKGLFKAMPTSWQQKIATKPMSPVETGELRQAAIEAQRGVAGGEEAEAGRQTVNRLLGKYGINPDDMASAVKKADPAMITRPWFKQFFGTYVAPRVTEEKLAETAVKAEPGVTKGQELVPTISKKEPGVVESVIDEITKLGIIPRAKNKLIEETGAIGKEDLVEGTLDKAGKIQFTKPEKRSISQGYKREVIGPIVAEDELLKEQMATKDLSTGLPYEKPKGIIPKIKEKLVEETGALFPEKPPIKPLGPTPSKVKPKTKPEVTIIPGQISSAPHIPPKMQVKNIVKPTPSLPDEPNKSTDYLTPYASNEQIFLPVNSGMSRREIKASYAPEAMKKLAL